MKHLISPLAFLALSLTFTACGSGGSSDSGGGGSTTTSTIGSASGGSVASVNGYDYSSNLEIVVEITPYTNGFKATFTPQTGSGSFICSLSNYVTQNGSQYSFRVIDTKSEYDTLSAYYDGYVESGAFDNCATYYTETVWVVLASSAGFSASSSYTVILGDVNDTDGFTAQQISVTP